MGHTDSVGLLGIEGIEQEEVLGRGAFGVVYRAWQPSLQRDVAVKVLVGAFDPAALRRFERECGTIGSLSGEPGIVTVYAAGRTREGSPYLVMRYMGGGTLGDRLRKGPIPWAEVASTGTAVGQALAAAHANGILHLDIKPGNVLLDGHGRPHLADFGIARFIDTEQRGQTATIAGTPGFAAPEIFDGRQPSVRSDVYGLGATLHALAGGRTPFTLSGAGGLSGLLQQIANEDPPDLRLHGVPDPLCSVVERAMAKDPDDRFASMTELVAALEALPAELVTAGGGERAERAADGGTAAAPPDRGRGRPSPPDDPTTLDEEQLKGHRRTPMLPSGVVPEDDRTVTPGGPRPAGTGANAPADAGSCGGAGLVVDETSPASEAGGDEGEGGPPSLARWRPLLATVAALVVVGVVVAGAVALTGTNDDPPTEDLAQPDADSAETGQLLQWLAIIRQIDERLFVAPAGGFADVCRDGLDRLEGPFGVVPFGAERLIPDRLGPAIAAQGEPARSLWVELVDASTQRLRDCAAEDLSAAEDAELKARIEAARQELDRVLQERPAEATAGDGE